MERLQNDNKKYTAVSLFAGIGGFDLGFEYAGFNVIWANDFDKYACKTYKANVGDNIVCGDIRIEKESIPQHQVLLAGFPCQPFSRLGKMEGFNDERGTLFFQIVEILKKYDTRVVVLENVKNIINHNKGKTFKRVIDELENIGYRCFWQVLNSADYGIPQRRNRCYIVALSKKYFKDVEFQFPEKIPLTYTTQDLLDTEVPSKYFITKNYISTVMSSGTKDFCATPTINLPVSKTLVATMHKMHRAGTDNYVTDVSNWEKADNPNLTSLRRLTPNECRKLQGFPSDWNQVVSDTQAYRQFGNAVTVEVSYNVAKRLFDYIETNQVGDWSQTVTA